MLEPYQYSTSNLVIGGLHVDITPGAENGYSNLRANSLHSLNLPFIAAYIC